MTKQETNKILALILEVYPLFGKDRNPEITSTIWNKIFEDEPYGVVEKAVLAFIATETKGFPPTPGNIKDKIQQLTQTEEPTEIEAWSMVLKAVRNGFYGAEEEWKKLPREIQEIVGNPSMIREWSQLSVDEINTVVASNFQRSYRARSESRRAYGLLPTSIRITLPRYQENKNLESGLNVLEEGNVEEDKEDYQYTEMPQSFREIAERCLGLKEANV